VLFIFFKFCDENCQNFLILSRCLYYSFNAVLFTYVFHRIDKILAVLRTKQKYEFFQFAIMKYNNLIFNKVLRRQSTLNNLFTRVTSQDISFVYFLLAFLYGYGFRFSIWFILSISCTLAEA